MSKWSDWTSCSQICGGDGGRQVRNRTTIVQPKNNGTKCPTISEVRFCNEKPCPIIFDSQNCPGYQKIGDGKCDITNQDSADCNHDGGDCCQKDWFNNGRCDDLNKFESCGDYDGGDCKGMLISNL